MWDSAEAEAASTRESLRMATSTRESGEAVQLSSKKETLYFRVPGKQNTDAVLEHVKEYLEREDLRNVVVATSSGETGSKAAKLLRDKNLVVVTHHHGFLQPDESELNPEFLKEIEANGGKVCTGTHALSSADRAVRKQLGTVEALELIAYTLRLFGQGSKVCVEVTLMAADAGLIPIEEDVVAIGGTGTGCDTALRIKPANASRLFDLRIREVIAKPSEF